MYNINKGLKLFVCSGLISILFPLSLPPMLGEISAANNQSTSNEMTKETMSTSEKTTTPIKTNTISITNTHKIQPNHVYVPKDTVISVMLTEEISSKKISKGSPVPLVLKENLIVNDVIIAPAGTEVVGTVTKSSGNGFFGKSGDLKFSIDYFKTINGVKIPLKYVAEKKAHRENGAIAVAVALSLLGGFLMKGKNVSFDKGTVFDAMVTEDTDLNTTFDKLADTMDPKKPHGTAIIIKQ